MYGLRDISLLGFVFCAVAVSSSAAGSPFYEIDVVARIDDEVDGIDGDGDGVDVTTTYIADLDNLITGNDLGKVAFDCVVTDSGASRFWQVLVANTSPTGGLHRLQDLDTHPLGGIGLYYEQLQLIRNRFSGGTDIRKMTRFCYST